MFFYSEKISAHHLTNKTTAFFSFEKNIKGILQNHTRLHAINKIFTDLSFSVPVFSKQVLIFSNVRDKNWDLIKMKSRLKRGITFKSST